MLARFSGGWNFTEDDAKHRLPAGIGYTMGAPMGGDLPNAPDGKALSFLVAALRDPYSGNLDRIQIVMVWLNKKGDRQEKVFDVVWSADRQSGAAGKCSLRSATIAAFSNTVTASPNPSKPFVFSSSTAPLIVLFSSC